MSIELEETQAAHQETDEKSQEISREKSDSAADQVLTVDDEQSDVQIKIPSRCHESIFNAFLILKYRDFKAEEDLEWTENNKYKYSQNLKSSLGILAYMVMIVQYVALALLIRVTMLSSGKSIKQWLLQLRDIDAEINTKSLYIFPFLWIALMSRWKDVGQSWEDGHVLQNWNIAKLGRRRVVYHQFHGRVLKRYGEFMLSVWGSMTYFTVLSIYSKTDSWEDILNIILNLLVYQFILEADEWAYSWIKLRIEKFVARCTKKQINILDGYVCINQEPPIGETFFQYWILYASCYAVLCQGLLSNHAFIHIAGIVGICVFWLILMIYWNLCIMNRRLL